MANGKARYKRRRIPSDEIRWPNIILVNKPPGQLPGVGETRTSPAAAFVPDGFIYPTPDAIFFDATVRAAQLPVATVTTQRVLTVEVGSKGGWIRKLGYGFNNPHGYFKVRTTVKIDGITPPNYLWKTVDPATGTYQGSFPTLQLGSIHDPFDVYIRLPGNAKVDIEWNNQSADEQFSGAVRLFGWSYST